MAETYFVPEKGESGKPVRVLYISYDGLLEPLGQSQILPYLDRLSARQVDFFLLTFEKKGGKGAKEEREALRKHLRQKGIRWVPLRYHKTPTVPATLYDILVGFAVGATIVMRHKVQIAHARSYVSALIALALKKVLGVKFLFDMRGFWADERVDGKMWRLGGLLYRLAKALEKVYLTEADTVVSLTSAAGKEIAAFEYLGYCCPRIAVIPTCVDLDRFRIRDRGGEPPRGLSGTTRFTLAYSGSLGTWYALDEMMAFFLVIKRHIPGARFLILTQTPRRDVERVGEKYSLSEGDLTVHAVPHWNMPEWIAAADVGVIFSRPSWANKARCPTKLGEFLACGVPVVMSQDIGDTEAIIRRERVGLAVQQFTEAAYEDALSVLRDLLGEAGLKERCRRVAERYFSLEQGVLKYQKVYEGLTDGFWAPSTSEQPS